MSTTPSIIESTDIPYTVVGGKNLDRGIPARYPVTVILLNRAGRFHREELIRTLTDMHFGEILCVESGIAGWDIEHQCRLFPALRYLVLAEPSDPGTRINIGMAEARFPFVFVIWNDLSIIPFLESSMTSLIAKDALCVVPLLRGPKGDVVPTLSMPAEKNNNLKIIHLPPSYDNLASLYPFDYVGVYQKEKFIQTQGFDSGIKSAFWQKMDFGYRAYLWGERIVCQNEVRLQTSFDLEPDDATPDEGYARFYLRNLLPVFMGDHAILPFSRFPRFLRVSRSGIFKDLAAFKRTKRWVDAHAWRFKRDARYVAELWDTEGGV